MALNKLKKFMGDFFLFNSQRIILRNFLPKNPGLVGDEIKCPQR